MMTETAKPVVQRILAVAIMFGVAMPGAFAQAQPSGQTGDVQAPAAQVDLNPQPTTAPETQSLHVQVGRSIVINTQARLRRVLVSNQAVLDALTVNSKQVVVSAKAPGSSSLVLWDENGQARILDVYADVDVSGLRDSLRQAFPNETLQVEPEQGRIILSGDVSTKASADEALKMAGLFSKDVVNSMNVAPPVRGRQIMLKVRFAEVNRNKIDAFGINILSTGATNTVGTISTQQFGPPMLGTAGQGKVPANTLSVSDLLNVFLFRPDLNLGATIKALQQKNVLQILAEPNLMARSGEPARFLAGGEFPFPVVQGGGGNFAAVTIQFRPFGVRLDFTGTVGDDNVIRLKVAPEVSALDFSNAVTISGFTVPALSTRRAETEIELRDGQTFGIAGLLDQRTTALFSKVPGIGDVPILGLLFRSKQVTRSNTELLVLVTPTIVDPLTGTHEPVAVPSAPLKNLNPKDFDRGVAKPSDKATTPAE
ncbi:MAG TPA: type II and III secretion system protein family protein [Clostridia bacterium]|nr:type II and III secretion system protein family protein [Clostridia bacterium]